MSTEVTSNARTAEQILGDEFLIARAKILELAATLDRIEHGSGFVEEDRAMQLLAHGLQILIDDQSEKAKRVQLLMSREYDPDWKQKFFGN